jgi:lipid II:glycine glycyltransferase (peptidoglycan interpeptide bridge formation enzyme)
MPATDIEARVRAIEAGIREATPAELERWHAITVDVPEGHAYQSRTWAAERAKLGWRPRFVMIDGDHGALVLERPFPWVGGASAYIPRGPVPDFRDSDDEIAARTIALARWLAGRGVDVVATDAEIDVDHSMVALGLGGFHAIPEIQPSRHRLVLELASGIDDAAERERLVHAGVSKSTRQRIASAENGGVVVHRYDSAGWDGAGETLFGPGDRPLDPVLGDFATLLEGTGERRGFRFGPRQVFIDWWRAGIAAGLVVHLEARDGAEVLGGLLLYRHGERLSTVHSADAPGIRERHPGVMHLLRWRAIQLAIRERRREMDLGGVDVGPDHEIPAKGDPMYGLYEHKRSFGAGVVAMVGAHERVARPWRYALGRLTTRVARIVRW